MSVGVGEGVGVDVGVGVCSGVDTGVCVGFDWGVSSAEGVCMGVLVGVGVAWTELSGGCSVNVDVSVVPGRSKAIIIVTAIIIILFIFFASLYSSRFNSLAALSYSIARRSVSVKLRAINLDSSSLAQARG